jgi:type II secretory pathway pseudopilin PulG
MSFANKNVSLKASKSYFAGFTLVELIITIAIFVFMTALVMARYNDYYSGTIFKNLAYDIAITIREAQSYGISVKVREGNNAEENFSKAYVVTSRYSTLKSDVEYWFKKLNGDSIFEGCYYNEGDIQPHLHKETMIKKLNLDYFVEDNWNIVQHVNDNLHKNNLKTKVLWISNIIDYRIPYEHKFSSLKKVVEFLKHEFEK